MSGHVVRADYRVYEPLQVLGKYLAFRGLLAAGPQSQVAMDLPPSVVPTSAVVPVWTGVRETALLLSLVLPRSVAGLPTTLMTPLASRAMLTTYLEAWVAHAAGSRVLMSA
mgnify:CR=1 FL=1